MLYSLACRIFTGQLCRKGSRFTRTLKPQPRRGPGDDVPLDIANSDDGVVKGGHDVGHTSGYILFNLLFSASSSWTRHLLFSLSLFTNVYALGTFPRSGIGVGALTADGKPSHVTEPSVALKIH